LNNRPRGAVAYKFDAEEFETEIKQIIVQVGNSGRITPIAIVKPVDILGVTVEKASIHNQSYIADLNLNVEYRYNKRISAWTSFNNALALKYQRYSAYNNQRFLWTLGATYAF
jgi:hypothetical protein